MAARYYSKIIFIDGDSSQGVPLVFIDTTLLLSEYYQGSDHHVQDLYRAPDLRRRPSLFILMADVSPNPRMDLWILHYRQTN